MSENHPIVDEIIDHTERIDPIRMAAAIEATRCCPAAEPGPQGEAGRGTTWWDVLNAADAFRDAELRLFHLQTEMFNVSGRIGDAKLDFERAKNELLRVARALGGRDG